MEPEDPFPRARLSFLRGLPAVRALRVERVYVTHVLPLLGAMRGGLEEVGLEVVLVSGRRREIVHGEGVGRVLRGVGGMANCAGVRRWEVGVVDERAEGERTHGWMDADWRAWVEKYEERGVEVVVLEPY